jgi:hypothetical protein
VKTDMMTAIHVCLAISASAVIALTQATPAAADAWTIAGNVLFPKGSLESHQPGPGVSVEWRRPLSPQWNCSASTGYLTLLTKSTPSYQMVPFEAGIEWLPRENAHGPFFAAGAGVFVTVESFRFLIGESTVKDDDWAVSVGPTVALGYRLSHLTASIGYQVVSFANDAPASVFRLRMGYRL